MKTPSKNKGGAIKSRTTSLKQAIKKETNTRITFSEIPFNRKVKKTNNLNKKSSVNKLPNKLSNKSKSKSKQLLSSSPLKLVPKETSKLAAQPRKNQAKSPELKKSFPKPDYRIKKLLGSKDKTKVSRENINSDSDNESVESAVLDEEICYECGFPTTDKESWQNVILCDLCDGQYHIQCVSKDRIPRSQFRCPKCKQDDMNFRKLKYHVDHLPTTKKSKAASLDYYYSPSRPLTSAWNECLSKHLMVVRDVFSFDILRRLTHGPVDKFSSSGRPTESWKGAVSEFTHRIGDSCRNLVPRGGRYDFSLPRFVVEGLGLEDLLSPILEKLRGIMATPPPILRTHNIVFVPCGTPDQPWHFDDVPTTSKPRYFTILIHLNPIDAACGGTEIWSKSLKRLDLIRGRPGDAFVFSGSLEHRGLENRAHDVLRRMEDNMHQVEAMKTCFGILAMMSRDDSNKSLIANDGMDLILNVMTTHVDKTDVQESGCDLLWSLAFNNTVVKEIIGKCGGASVLVRALKRHCRSPEFLKSACGALSNLCQSKLNQEGVATQGGLQPLVGAIHSHQTNGKLLPFIFDAIASLIVSNEENARTVSTLGLIPLVISSLARHKITTEVVKSACHCLAILSDVKGQASKIAFAGGVPIILSLLDSHPSYSDLHRVAAVVLLRMLQESNHVSREITSHEGVRILFKSLEKGGAQQDTVAAVTHILFTVTNPALPSSSLIESQLWITPSISNTDQILAEPQSSKGLGSDFSHTALTGLVMMLGRHSDRRDVVRATCRLLNNLGEYPGVIQALDKLSILEVMMECLNQHRETKDVIECSAYLVKAINRRAAPTMTGSKTQQLDGILHLYRLKSHDEEAVLACSSVISRLIESHLTAKPKKLPETETPTKPSTEWVIETIKISNSILEKVSGVEEDEKSCSSQSVLGSSRRGWTRLTGKVVSSLLTTLTASVSYLKPQHMEPMILDSIRQILKLTAESLPARHSDLGRHIELILSALTRDPEIRSLPSNSIEAENHRNFSRKSLADDYATFGHDEKSTFDPSPPSFPCTTTPQIKKLLQSKSKSSSSLTPEPPFDTNTESESLSKDESLLSSVQTEPHPRAKSSMPTALRDRKSGRCLPLHPLKFSKTASSLAESPSHLIDSWPDFQERLLPPPTPSMFDPRPTDVPSGFTGLSIPNRMHTVYEGASAAGKGLLSRVSTPVPYEVPLGGNGPSFEHSLTFDSEFESGNLLRAVQRGETLYDLFLRADLHTSGHTQWFYFAISNTHSESLLQQCEQNGTVPPATTYRFNIVNLTKPDSLFNLGMRPVVYSCHEASTKSQGWMRAGHDISYYNNSFVRNNSAGEGFSNYFTLSFSLECKHPRDTILIAYSYPYTMNDHKQHLNRILSHTNIVKSSRLCSTLGGEDCDLLVITNFKDKDKDRIGPITCSMVDENVVSSSNKRNSAFGMGSRSDSKGVSSAGKSLKPALFISGRVHPGETPASWMMRGILDFLTSESPSAQLLRKSYVIFVIPVLNPDGVIYGNNRCSLAGVDLNRQWKSPVKNLHPTVFHLKSFMMAQKRIRDIYMYIDLHGHSRKYNVFMYGCEEKKKPRPQVRSFPKFFSMHPAGRKYVSFNDCSFHIKKGRESTARVVVMKELNILYSYTLEATFCGSNIGPLKHCHMHIGHLQEVGGAMCDAILQFSISDGYLKEGLVLPPNPRIGIGETDFDFLASNTNPTTSVKDSIKSDAGSSTKSEVVQSVIQDEEPDEVSSGSEDEEGEGDGEEGGDNRLKSDSDMEGDSSKTRQFSSLSDPCGPITKFKQEDLSFRRGPTSLPLTSRSIGDREISEQRILPSTTSSSSPLGYPPSGRNSLSISEIENLKFDDSMASGANSDRGASSDRGYALIRRKEPSPLPLSRSSAGSGRLSSSRKSREEIRFEDRGSGSGLAQWPSITADFPRSQSREKNYSSLFPDTKVELPDRPQSFDLKKDFVRPSSLSSHIGLPKVSKM